MPWRFSHQSGFLHVRPVSLRLPSRLLSSAPWLLTGQIPVTSHTIASILALAPAPDTQGPRRVVVTGHVRTVRNQKRHSFVEIGDGSTIHTLQALLQPSQAVNLGTGSAVTIAGLWQPSPPGKEQSYELHAEHVRIVGTADPELYPLQKKYHSAEYLRTIPHLRLRTPFNALLARLRSECEHYISTFFRSSDFVRLQPPIITSSDCEGAGEVFTLRPKEARHDSTETSQHAADEFFRSPKFLTVSSQLHLEAFVHEHQKVWTLSPTFRAERSDTPRHLSEFYMLEAEIRTESLAALMDLVENLIRAVAVQLVSSDVGKELLTVKHGAESNESKCMTPKIEVIHRRWLGLKRSFWPRITYSEAIKVLQTADAAGETSFQYKPNWQHGLHLEHEKFIASEIGQGSPVFVTDYPTLVKPFYMLPSQPESAQSESSPSTVACFDLLLPESCEVVGGSLREHRLELLVQAMRNHGLLPAHQTPEAVLDPKKHSEPSNLDWYIDLRRYGSVPHGGFGLGFDRLLGYLAGVDSVRDVAPWPRYYGKCDC